MNIHKKYQLVKEHPTHFEIHDTTDGKRFPIAKKDLHPASQIKLMKMQKFSGEDSEENPEEQVVQPAEDASDQSMGAEDNASASADMTAPSQPEMQAGWQAPMLAPGQAPMNPEVMPAEQTQNPAINPQANMPGMEQTKKGIEAQGASANQFAKDQQIALEQHQQNLQAFQEEHLKNVAVLDKEQDDYKKQLMSGKIDPKRYFNNMSTGQRIGTAIGLILGGIGSGLTHGPNLAVQIMNKAIDDDINAQKEDLGKTRSLLSLNLQKYHRLDSAEMATRLQYNTALQIQLQAASSKATNGLAQGAMNMKLGQIESQNAFYKQKIAENISRGQNLGYGSGEGGTPVWQENFQMLMDPKYQEKRVVVDGKAYQAADKTDAEKLRRTESIAGPVKTQVQDLQALANDPTTRFQGTPSNLKAHAIMGNLSVQLPQLSGLTRVNEVEIKHLADSFQDPTRFDQSLGSVKNVQFLKMMEDDLEAKRSAGLIGYKGIGNVKSFAPASGALPLNRK